MSITTVQTNRHQVMATTRANSQTDTEGRASPRIRAREEDRHKRRRRLFLQGPTHVR